MSEAASCGPPKETARERLEGYHLAPVACTARRHHQGQDPGVRPARHAGPDPCDDARVLQRAQAVAQPTDHRAAAWRELRDRAPIGPVARRAARSEEHTSELQSLAYLV